MTDTMLYVVLAAIFWPVPVLVWILLGMSVMDAIAGDRRLSEWVMACPRGLGLIAGCLWPLLVVAWFVRR